MSLYFMQKYSQKTAKTYGKVSVIKAENDIQAYHNHGSDKETAVILFRYPGDRLIDSISAYNTKGREVHTE